MGYNADLLGNQVSNSSPYVVSASSEHGSGTAPAWKAFDGDDDSAWTSLDNAGLPQWLKADFGVGNAKKVAEYTMEMYPQSIYRVDAWTFEGSNDDSNWTVLDTRIGQQSLTGFQTYAFANAVAYRYYRLNISSGGTDKIAIQTLTMHEKDHLTSPFPTFHRV